MLASSVHFQHGTIPQVTGRISFYRTHSIETHEKLFVRNQVSSTQSATFTPESFTIRRALHISVNDVKKALLHLAQNRSGGLFRTYTARFCYRASSGIIRHESSLAACLDRFSQSSVVDDGEFSTLVSIP